MTIRHFASLVGAAAVGVMLFVPTQVTAQTFAPNAQQPGPVKPIDAISAVVKTGDTVSVLQANGAKIFGQVEHLSPSGLTLVSEGLRLQVAPDAVRQIDVYHRHPFRGLLIGTLIGAGAGLALGSGNTSGSEDYSGFFAVVGAIVGAGIGAGVGAHQEASTVYTAPPSRPGIVITPRSAAIHVGFRF